MRYKDYIARIEYSDEAGCFIGHAVGMRDVVSFHGESLTELRAAFEEAVDDYEDILVVKKRIQEAKSEPAIMRPISELRASLETAGLLDE
jgi:predicted HicB family RNase H-like nuclease